MAKAKENGRNDVVNPEIATGPGSWLTKDAPVKDETNVNVDDWRQIKPHGLSGMFRLRDEGQFMDAAIASHLPALDELVFIVQPSEDDTIAKAIKWARWINSACMDKTARVFVYMDDVWPIDSKQHYSGSLQDPRHMVHLTNYAISRCQYAFIAKIEGDMIACPGWAHDSRTAIDEYTGRRDMYFGSVGLNVAGEGMECVSATAPRNAGWDVGIFSNTPDIPCVRYGKWESIAHMNKGVCRVSLGWQFWHVKRCQRENLGLIGGEHWVPIRDLDAVGEAVVKWEKENKRKEGIWDAASSWKMLNDPPTPQLVDAYRQVNAGGGVNGQDIPS